MDEILKFSVVDDIMLLYDTCRFDKALHPHQKSPWCVVFSDYDLKVSKKSYELI